MTGQCLPLWCWFCPLHGCIHMRTIFRLRPSLQIWLWMGIFPRHQHNRWHLPCCPFKILCLLGQLLFLMGLLASQLPRLSALPLNLFLTFWQIRTQIFVQPPECIQTWEVNLSKPQCQHLYHGDSRCLLYRIVIRINIPWPKHVLHSQGSENVGCYCLKKQQTQNHPLSPVSPLSTHLHFYCLYLTWNLLILFT